MVNTRLFIISDTHGQPGQGMKALGRVDVAIHCGDLTEESRIEEYQSALNLLKEINAPLKLVIAGNHDFTMDEPAFERKISEARQTLEPELVAKFYGRPGESRQLFESEEAKSAGIVFLDEGTHQFKLQNGATLNVYASPYTPSFGQWGFQYHPNKGRHFEIQEGVDVVVTHGPPKGIMDVTASGERAGCPDLFAAVARARPRIHCFGHVHEGWGAKLVSWREFISKNPSHFTAIDNEKSTVLEKLSNLKESRFDTPETLREKLEKKEFYQRERCCKTSHFDYKPNSSLKMGQQTLFVNSAIQGDEDYPDHVPWLIEVDLPASEL